MIKARHHNWVVGFFDLYTQVQLKRYFSSVRLVGDVAVAGRPVLLIANHLSWWDGFWLLHLNKERLQKRFHVMMLETQLAPRRYLSRAGAFSIAPGKRSAIESLRYAGELLAESGDNMVAIYPQGQIQSQRLTELRFQKGIERVIAFAPGNTALLSVVAFTDYAAEQKPLLTLYYTEQALSEDAEELESNYNQFYQQCHQQQCEYVAALTA